MRKFGGSTSLELAPAIVVGPCPNPHATRWSYDVGTARRIKDMAGYELPFFNIFEVEPEKWSREAARAEVAAWCLEVQHEKTKTWTIVLMGTKVCDAFGIAQPEWLEWYRSASVPGPMIAFPHTSGLNRWWNDEENARRGSALLWRVAHGELPRLEKNGAIE